MASRIRPEAASGRIVPTQISTSFGESQSLHAAYAGCSRLTVPLALGTTYISLHLFSARSQLLRPKLCTLRNRSPRPGLRRPQALSPAPGQFLLAHYTRTLCTHPRKDTLYRRTLCISDNLYGHCSPVGSLAGSSVIPLFPHPNLIPKARRRLSNLDRHTQSSRDASRQMHWSNATQWIARISLPFYGQAKQTDSQL